VKIFAWPPVGVIGHEWTEEQPVQRSRNAWTGKRSVSALGPRRRVARLDVSALARGGYGAGYSEALKRLLDGGVHLVRIASLPINWHLAPTPWRNAPVQWATDDGPLAWTASTNPVRWFTGPAIAGTPGTDTDGFDTVTVGGLPANAIIAGPGDFLRVYPYSGSDVAEGVAAQIVAPVITDGTGAAVVRLFSEVPAGVVSFGDQDVGVFEAVDMPRAMQPLSANWTYSWNFREVLPSEIPDDADEVDPWR
jgi:hypothetical protein